MAAAVSAVRLLAPIFLLSLAVAANATDLLIENVTVVSAHLAEPETGQRVLIVDGRIAIITPEAIAVDEDMPRIDAKGLFLTPGIMDSHHHVSFMPGMGPIGFGLTTVHGELTDAYTRQQPRSLLYYGVTQVLDPAPMTAWRRFESQPRHPDLFRCGAIPNPGGYPEVEFAEETRDAMPYSIEKGTPESVVERIANDGAICVKLFVEDGFGDSTTWPLLDETTVDRILKAARMRDLLVYVHANAIDMYRVALDYSPDVMGHGLWNWQWPTGEPPVESTLDIVRDEYVGYIATHQVMLGLANQLRRETAKDPDFVDVVPPALLAWYDTDEAQWFADVLASDFPPDMSREDMAMILERGYARGKRATSYLAAAGHPLLLGSDCPGSPTYANQPGLCTYREIQSLAEAGVAPDAIFRAATINNAAQFRLDDAYGTVEKGKIANLLLLKANPLVNADAWNRIDTIILHGEAIAREELAADH